MNPIIELESAGYRFTLGGDQQIRYTLAPGKEVDPATVRPLLEQLKENKQDALAYLRERDTLPLTLAGADPSEEARAKAQLKRRGYFLMFSHALGEQVAVVEHDRFRQNVPAGIPTYTFEEIRLLQQGAEAGTIVNIGDLRAVHSAKKFKGAIIR